jgi:hypothetical protein
MGYKSLMLCVTRNLLVKSNILNILEVLHMSNISPKPQSLLFVEKQLLLNYFFTSLVILHWKVLHSTLSCSRILSFLIITYLSISYDWGKAEPYAYNNTPKQHTAHLMITKQCGNVLNYSYWPHVCTCTNSSFADILVVPMAKNKKKQWRSNCPIIRQSLSFKPKWQVYQGRGGCRPQIWPIYNCNHISCIYIKRYLFYIFIEPEKSRYLVLKIWV